MSRTATVTRYGRLVLPSTDDTVSRFLIRCGEWAWDEVGFIASVLPERARVLDVGAYLGTFALGLAQRADLDFVCLVEANAAILPLLEANIASNLAVASVVVHAAVGSVGMSGRPGRGDPANLGSISFAEDAIGDEIALPPKRLITLADLRSEHGRFDLIKIDAEGMEKEVLEGDAKYLSTGASSLWIECNEDRRSLEIARLLLQWELDVYYFSFPSHNPENFCGEVQPIFPWAYEAGLLAAPLTPPQLKTDLASHQCVLTRIGTVEELREAMWRTPRWLPSELAEANSVELAAAAGRALRGQERGTFLSSELDDPALSAHKSMRDQLRATEAGLSRAETLAFQRHADLQLERTRREAAEDGLSTAQTLVFERQTELEAERARREAAEDGLSTAQTLVFERQTELEAERARREAAEDGLSTAQKLVFERQTELDLERARREAAEDGLSAAQRLAFEQQKKLRQGQQRAEILEQRLANVNALALSRLASIGAERERTEAAEETNTRILAEAEARALATEAHADAQARASEVKWNQRLSDIEAQRRLSDMQASAAIAQLAAVQATIAWRLITPIHAFIASRPRLRETLRRVRGAAAYASGRRQ